MVTGIISYLRITFPVISIVVFLFVSPPLLLAADGSSSEVAFVELYAKIIRATDNGELDRSIGKKARLINSSLQKEIAAIETRLEALKTDSEKLKSSERDQFLDELIATGAERERIYLNYRQRLEQLAGPDRLDATAASATPTALKTGQESPKVESGKGNSPESSPRTITFKSEPEDVTTGEFD